MSSPPSSPPGGPGAKSRGDLGAVMFWTMLVLTLINFLNYIDRYVLAAVLDGVSTSFSLSDTQGGTLGTVFVVVYMIASPVTGALADRVTRKYLVAVGGGAVEPGHPRLRLWRAATTRCC